MKDVIHESLRGDAVVAAGDGQMDSPGHSLKYCIYTIMDEDVVDVQQAKGKSSVMEKVGCERTLKSLKSAVNVSEFITDASSQIIKMSREDPEFKDIVHQLDMWHKSIKIDMKLREVMYKIHTVACISKSCTNLKMHQILNIHRNLMIVIAHK